MNAITVSVIIAYLLLLVLIGWYSTRASSGGVSDFFLAGRGLGKFTVALSAVSSGRSGWLVLGVTGMAYASGLNAVWALTGYITVEVLLFYFAAYRYRRYSELYDAITIPDILATRFGDKSGLLRVTASLIIVFFMVAYVGSQLVAGGTAFSSGLGISPTAGLWATAAIILAYTMLGGFHAVSKTDVLQAIFMLFSLVILPLVAIINLGGFGPIIATMNQLGGGFSDPFVFGFGAIMGLLGIGFGSPGNPHILVRYMSLKNINEMKQAALIGSIWNVVMGWGAVMIGLAGRVYFPDINMLPDGNKEAIFPMLGQHLTNPFFLGIFLVAILAAIMSSADSQLLVGSSALVRDIYHRLFGGDREIPEQQLVLYSRLATALLMGMAIILALGAKEFVFWMVLFAWGGLGACFGPPLLLSLYWKRTTRWGVFWGMVSGLVTVVLVKKQPVWTVPLLGDVKAFFGKVLFGITYEAVPGFLVALLVTVVVSLLTQPPADAAEKLEKIAA